MSEQSDKELATRGDVRELREWIFDREVKAIRFFVIVGLAYFSITMGGVWFMVNAILNDIKSDVREIRSHLQGGNK